MNNFFTLPLVVFLLSSCSVFEPKKVQDTSWEELQKKLGAKCLQGNGSGRTRMDSRTLPFDYEAWRKQGKLRSWNLAMDFSMHGEELLKLSWHPQKKTVAIGGSFQKNYLSRSIATLSEKNHIEVKYLVRAVKDLALLTRQVVDGPWSCKKKTVGVFECSYFKKKFLIFHYGDMVKLVRASSKGVQASILMDEFEKNSARRFTFGLYHAEEQRLLSLDLLAEQCQR